MGCCFSLPSKSHNNTGHVVAQCEAAPKSMDAHTAASPNVDRLLGTRPNCEPVNRKPVPQQPLPMATHQTLQRGQLRVDASSGASHGQASPAHAAGPSRPHARDLGLKITTVPHSGQPMEPGNVSPVSVESISTHGGAKVRRMATTGGIRRKYELPPRKKRIEIGADEAIRE